MTVTLELPDEIAEGLGEKWPNLSRAALESLGLEAYRAELLSQAQLGRLLGFETRMEVDAFLGQHKVYDYTVEDLEADRATLAELRNSGVVRSTARQ